MRKAAVFLAASCFTGGIAVVGCSSSKPSPSSGASSSSSGAGGGGGGGGETAAPVLACTLPTMPPSKGSCVTFTSQPGVELDAGVDEGGNASVTTCNPITNEGCTGTDVCGPDNGAHFYCHPAGSMPNVTACGDCTSPHATCAIGGYCQPGASGATNTCFPMCCTDADCGTASGATCNARYFLPPLGSNVGVCLIQ